MHVIWLGHACFVLEWEDYRVVLDPYEGVEGYPALHLSADAVYCSHGHFDHSARAAVTLRAPRPSPFTVREIASFHDDVQGAKRGENTIRVLTAGGSSFCHLGDLGHLLSPEQVAAIGAVDVLAVPVGGVYTIGAEEAGAVVRQLHPRCAVPMHYRHAPCGLPNVGGVEPFAALFSPAEVTALSGRSLNTEDTLPAVAVLRYEGNALPSGE